MMTEENGGVNTWSAAMAGHIEGIRGKKQLSEKDVRNKVAAAGGHGNGPRAY